MDSKLRKELEDILPTNHPFLEKLDADPDELESELIGGPTNESVEIGPDWYKLIAQFVDTLDDWKRGIRGWSEVERELVNIKEKL